MVYTELTVQHPLAYNRKSIQSNIILSVFLCNLIAWALKRGFFTPRGARPDVYRAANHLLRLVSDGGIALFFMPPGQSF